MGNGCTIFSIKHLCNGEEFSIDNIEDKKKKW
jgi:hypothetical protein